MAATTTVGQLRLQWQRLKFQFDIKMKNENDKAEATKLTGEIVQKQQVDMI